MKIFRTLSLALLVLPAAAAAQGAADTSFALENLDFSAKPGADFYQFAAGGWAAAHPLKPEYSRYAQFDALAEQNELRLRTLLDALAATDALVPQSDGGKVAALYRLATDSVRLQREGAAPVLPALRRIADAATRDELQRVSFGLMRDGTTAFFRLGAGADPADARMNIVEVGQPPLTMSSREYYIDDDENARSIRHAFLAYARRLFELAGQSADEATTAADAALRIETQLARAARSNTELRDTEANYHPTTRTALAAERGGIDWEALFAAVGYPAFSAINVAQPEPIHEAERLLTEAPLGELKAYIALRLLDHAAPALSDDFVHAHFMFHDSALRGAEAERPRWKRALDIVEHCLGMALGKAYVENYFPATSKARMTALVAHLQEALAERIKTRTWMSEDTKAKALEKLSTFYVKIGYPEVWRSYDALTIDESASLLDALTAVARFEWADEAERRVGKPTDRDEWLMTPQTVNAYYNPSTNEICFPAGILQPPFFNAEADAAANYGAIGVVIGHEMTHGFDDQGARFDKDGNLRSWWTDEDFARFREHTQRMADFFSAQEVLPGMYANGELTLGENIADNGGLNVAYQAFLKHLEEHPLGEKEGFTPQQRFFLSYGLIWGNNIREERLRQLNKIDPHSPGRLRVNGALPHIDGWYDAFSISPSDPLYVPRSERVDVW